MFLLIYRYIDIEYLVLHHHTLGHTHLVIISIIVNKRQCEVLQRFQNIISVKLQY